MTFGPFQPARRTSALARRAARRAVPIVLILLLLTSSAAAQGRRSVAVFNFQMKSATDEWRWLEKGLADRVITDLFCSGMVDVINRDAMQETAEAMRWTPEMMSGKHDLGPIRVALKPQYLVSGLYEVSGDTLSITAFVVELATSREVARRHISGPCPEALDLSRTLSVQLLALLTGKSDAEILPALPVWTRSLPAAKAVYEGIDLYDQGRYGEAWLNFSRAAREDANYLDAQYWVGKMYYFLDRYRHARISLEKFLYQNPDHPRTGDAVMEFLHTYEYLDTPPETLLEINHQLERRFDTTLFRDGSYGQGTIIGRVLRQKRLQILDSLGRHDEALKLMALVHPGGKEGIGAGRVSLPAPAALGHYVRLGYTFSTAELLDYFNLPNWANVIRFEPHKLAISISPGGATRQQGEEWFRGNRMASLLLAPSNYAITSVTVFPEGDAGNPVQLTLMLWGPQTMDAITQTHGATSGPSDAITAANLPRLNYLTMKIRYRSRRPVESFRLVAEIEPIGPHGSLDVSCPSTAAFTVAVANRNVGRGPGLIGPLPPGRHILEFQHRSSNCYQPARSLVEIVEGRTTHVEQQLLWREDGPFAGWNNGVHIGRNYGILPTAVSPENPPTVLADDDAIHVVWARHGDLWHSTSRDGRTFTPPRRLCLPISTAWDERDPRLVRDEAGRYLLLFRGNRDIRHRSLPYICWSRDMINWSAPALLGSDQFFAGLVRITHQSPVALAGHPLAWQLALCQNDLWQPPWDLNRLHSRMNRAGLLREDGVYEFYRLNPDAGKRKARLVQYLSSDGLNWTENAMIAEMPATDREFSVRAVRADNRSIVAVLEVTQDEKRRSAIKLFRQLPDRQSPDKQALDRKPFDSRWEQSPWFDDIAHPLADMAYHPRWGYIIAWDGPYLISGPQIDTLFSAPAHADVLLRENGDGLD